MIYHLQSEYYKSYLADITSLPKKKPKKEKIRKRAFKPSNIDYGYYTLDDIVWNMQLKEIGV